MNELFLGDNNELIDKSDNKIKWIYELVDCILSNNFYIENFINILEKQNFYSLIKGKRLDMFLSEMHEIEHIEKEKTRLQIFIKYIDLFYPLFWEKSQEIISYYLRIIISEIINKSDNDEIKIITPISLITILQNIHWDLTITRNRINKNEQSDMFYQELEQNFTHIDEKKDICLFIWQYPIYFFNVLLTYSYKNNLFIDEKLLNIIWKIPVATGSLDSDIFLQKNFRYELNNNDWLPIILKFSYNSEVYFKIFFQENSILFEAINKKAEKVEGSFTIFKEEIELLLNWLLKLPWRSYSDMKACLEIFFQEKRKLYSKQIDNIVEKTDK